MTDDINLKAAKILRDARRYIKIKGWTKHTVMNSEGQMCASGAMNMAAYDDPTASGIMSHKPERRRASTTLTQILGGNTCTIIGWNDNPSTTEADVLRVMKQAAKQLEAEANV